MDKNTQNTQNTEITLFDTAQLAGIEITDNKCTFRGIPVSNALAKECKAFFAADLLERQAKIKKGIALWTIKNNRLADIYDTDENGKPYAVKDGKHTNAAVDKMFNRFMKEANIPQSTWSRLIRIANLCCEPVLDKDGNVVTLKRIKNAERLPESVITYCEEHKVPKGVFAKFCEESTRLDFKGVPDFLVYFQSWTAQEAKKLGMTAPAENAQEATQEATQEAAQEATQDSNNKKSSKKEAAQEAAQDVPISICGKVDYEYIVANSISHNTYLPVPRKEFEDMLNDINPDTTEALENAIHHAIARPMIADDYTYDIREIHGGIAFTISYACLDSKGHYVNTYIDTFVKMEDGYSVHLKK